MRKSIVGDSNYFYEPVVTSYVKGITGFPKLLFDTNIIIYYRDDCFLVGQTVYDNKLHKVKIPFTVALKSDVFAVVSTILLNLSFEKEDYTSQESSMVTRWFERCVYYHYKNGGLG